MIRRLICWWKQEHKWSEWIETMYSDGRTKYYQRLCHRCSKWETALERPEE